ncbi:MAG: YfcC family protein [Lawsonibacter sp.]|nr:YfcC family protein [Lawsonibacter sp.]
MRRRGSGDSRRQTPHVFLILSALLLLASALTWLIPAGSYDRVLNAATGQTVVVPGSFRYTAPTPVAPWRLPLALFHAFSSGSAPKLIFFVFFLNGTFEIILESGAVAALCSWVVGKFRHRRAWLVPVFVGTFSVLGFTMGLTTASIVFLPLGMAAAKSLGYDAKTGMAMVMLGTNAGFAAGIYNPFSVGIAQTIAELPLYSGAWLRWLLLAALVTATSLYILLRAGRASPTAETESIAEQAGLTPQQGLILALSLGALALVIWGVSDWGWSLEEIAAIFLVLGILCGMAAGFEANQICALFTAGCKKMVGGALTIGMAAALRLVLVQGGILDSVIYGLLQLVGRLPAWSHLLGMFYANVLLDLLITSGSGHAAVAMPLMVPLADALSLSRQSAVLAFQLGDGLVNLVSPVSNTLVSCLALSELSYPKWLRYFLPLVGIYLLIGTAFLLLAGAVGY